MTIEELQRQVRQLKEAKGFEIAREVLKLSRDGNKDVGEIGPAEVEAVLEKLGVEIYDVVWNLWDLADMVGVDLEDAFCKKADLNVGREW